MIPEKSSLRAFTLIELLTVIAIIGILAAILIPVVGMARQTARKADAVTRLRQIGVAILGYTNDNKGCLPASWYSGITFHYGRGDSGVLAAALASWLGYPAQEDMPTGVQYYAREFTCPFIAASGPLDDGVPHYIQNLSLDPLLQYPFGRQSSSPKWDPLFLHDIESSGGASRIWAITNADQQQPAWLDPRSGWYGKLPKEPVMKNNRVRLYFDAHVASVPLNAPNF